MIIFKMHPHGEITLDNFKLILKTLNFHNIHVETLFRQVIFHEN
eukprot:UN00802